MEEKKRREIISYVSEVRAGYVWRLGPLTDSEDL